jgi:hypothetical protein
VIDHTLHGPHIAPSAVDELMHLIEYEGEQGVNDRPVDHANDVDHANHVDHRQLLSEDEGCEWQWEDKEEGEDVAPPIGASTWVSPSPTFNNNDNNKHPYACTTE